MTVVQFLPAVHAVRSTHSVATRTQGGNTPLRSLAGGSLAGRFHAWRGRSGRRYVCSVFRAHPLMPDVGLPDYAEAVVIAAARDVDGVRRIVGILQSESTVADALRTAFVADTLAAGVTEWHVHLLAASADERRAVVADLGPLLPR